MKKLLIGSLVGAILLFGWQAVSWTAIGIHDDSFKYTSTQDTIMNTLLKNLTAEGEYLIPTASSELPREERMKINNAHMGKPWASIHFHPQGQGAMGPTMLKGFINSFICVLLVCLVIRKFDIRYKTFFSLFTAVLTFGVISFLFVWYNQHNWFQSTWNLIWGELIDDFAGWGLVGVWLGWYYKK